MKDYVIGDPYAVGENEDQVPALRIEVANGESKLTRGPSVTGIKVISVDPNGPAAIAGLQGERMMARTALTAALAVGGMVFPPAMFVAMLAQQSDVGESHDLIIAVDGERTRNIVDLQDALDRAHVRSFIWTSSVQAADNTSQYACPVSCRHIGAINMWDEPNVHGQSKLAGIFLSMPTVILCSPRATG